MTVARASVVDYECERCARQHSAEMSRVIDEAAPQKTDEQVDHDHRNQTGAKCAFETFRQLVPKLDTKNKQHANESKQRPRSSGRGGINGLEYKSAQAASGQTWSYCQITCDYTGNSGQHPKHDKLRRPVDFFHIRAKYPKAVHVHRNMDEVHVNKHRRNESPPLMIRSIDVLI